MHFYHNSDNFWRFLLFSAKHPTVLFGERTNESELLFNQLLNFVQKSTFFEPKKQQKAEKSLKFYKGYTGKSVDEVIAISAEFERLKAIANKLKVDEDIMLKDICKQQYNFLVFH